MLQFISVTGYRGCERVRATFTCKDSDDFLRQVLEWEKANQITEWSRDRF